MADELRAGNIQLEDYVTGGASHHFYEDEVLAIHHIPEDCIVGTFRLEEKEDWNSGAIK